MDRNGQFQIFPEKLKGCCQSHASLGIASLGLGWELGILVIWNLIMLSCHWLLSPSFFLSSLLLFKNPSPSPHFPHIFFCFSGSFFSLGTNCNWVFSVLNKNTKDQSFRHGLNLQQRKKALFHRGRWWVGLTGRHGSWVFWEPPPIFFKAYVLCKEERQLQKPLWHGFVFFLFFLVPEIWAVLWCQIWRSPPAPFLGSLFSLQEATWW